MQLLIQSRTYQSLWSSWDIWDLLLDTQQFGVSSTRTCSISACSSSFYSLASQGPQNKITPGTTGKQKKKRIALVNEAIGGFMIWGMIMEEWSTPGKAGWQARQQPMVQFTEQNKPSKVPSGKQMWILKINEHQPCVDGIPTKSWWCWWKRVIFNTVCMFDYQRVPRTTKLSKLVLKASCA